MSAMYVVDGQIVYGARRVIGGILCICVCIWAVACVSTNYLPFVSKVRQFPQCITLTPDLILPFIAWC